MSRRERVRLLITASYVALAISVVVQALQSSSDHRSGTYVIGYLLGAASYLVWTGAFWFFIPTYWAFTQDLAVVELRLRLARAFRLFAVGALVFASSNLLFVFQYTHDHARHGFIIAVGIQLVANLSLAAGWWFWSMKRPPINAQASDDADRLSQ